jgi:hypothetical protein
MKRKFCVYLFILILVPFLLAVFAYGQSYQSFSYELQQIARNTKWKIGPFRIYPSIQFRDIGYDDNVYYKREDEDPISDYTWTLSPQLRVYLLFRNFLIFSLTENPEYVYYHKQKRERSLNNYLMPELKMLLFNRFVLSSGYLISKRRYRPSSEFDVRATQHSKEFISRFFYETARGTSIGFLASVRNITFEDVTLPGEEIYLSRVLDRRETSGQFEFYYRVFSESHFFLSGGYTEYDFRHEQSRWRDSYSYQIFSGIRFPLLGRLRGTLALGYKRLSSWRETKKDFSGLVGNTNLNLRIRRFGFRLLYRRDCFFSYYTDNVFFLEDRYGGGISFYLTRFLRLDYDFSYGKNRYPELITVRMPDGSYSDLERLDHNRNHTAGVVIRVVRSTGIGMKFTYWERESNVPWVERNRWFIGGYLTYEF